MKVVLTVGMTIPAGIVDSEEWIVREFNLEEDTMYLTNKDHPSAYIDGMSPSDLIARWEYNMECEEWTDK